MGRRLRAALVCAATVAGLVAGAQPSGAQTPGPVATAAEVAPEAVAAIARDLNCPLCQGYSLQDCPLTVCAQMRELIRQQLAAGESREAIVAYFVREYGPQVLSAPPTGGVFLAAWLLPVVALALGAVAVAMLLRRRGPRPGGLAVEPAPATAPTDLALAERLEHLVSDEGGR